MNITAVIWVLLATLLVVFVFLYLNQAGAI